MKAKKILSVVTASVMACSMGLAAVACGDEDLWTPPNNTDEYIIPQDYCRTYYEVFVRSFADSNGDGIGDLRGLANNLDYLNDGNDETMTDLGINGIWMMPIHSSPTYHKYDVIDYYSIDDEYGTLDDFDYLVAECNKRGIWLQMDLVLNHTSTQHAWFKAAVKAAQQGKSPMLDEDLLRYEIVKSTSKPEGSWYKISGTTDYWYLGNFSSEMPDVRLTNSEVREEIKNIVDFWLGRGIHSFRLDAVPWVCENDVIWTEKNGEFWTWFNNYCDEKGAEVYGKEDDGIEKYCYNVGEVLNYDASLVLDYFQTGMSNFNYAMGGKDQVGFAGCVNGRRRASTVVENLASYQAKALEYDSAALLSNFLSNHDNDRSAGYFQRNPEKIKMAAGMYLLAPGNPYIYYGEEIGALGSGTDPDKRLAFNWGDGRTVKDPLDAVYEGTQELGSVKSQTSDPNSILTYYREAIKLRNRFPEIGRGIIVPHALNADGVIALSADLNATLEGEQTLNTINSFNATVAVYTLEWNNRKVLIVQNVGTKSVNVGMSSEFAGYEIVGTLKAKGGDIALEDGKLALASGGVAVLKAAA